MMATMFVNKRRRARIVMRYYSTLCSQYTLRNTFKFSQIIVDASGAGSTTNFAPYAHIMRHTPTMSYFKLQSVSHAAVLPE